MRLSTLALALVAACCATSAWAAVPEARTQNRLSPQYGHWYRHGVIANLDVHAAMGRWAKQHQQVAGSQVLSYGGGTGGVGVMSGQNKVYLVFYGTQWGTRSTDANGNLKFANDAAGAAGAAQQLFKGIGTNGETWQNDLTQWCNGAIPGATSCAARLTRIPRQANILAGVWYDNTKASPAAATAAQLANEAIAAAAHFGNTTAASNRSAYYVILSPHGTNPDFYQGSYCAWHDYTADAGVTSPYGEMAFSNQPYNIDSGAGCGVGFVNSPGTLDGYTMTLGAQWHGMMSDQFPAGGWTNHNTGQYAGAEDWQDCGWIAQGQSGGAANVAFSTGTFALQADWSNDTSNCTMTHADVSGGGVGNAPPTANFSFITNGLTATFTDSSTDSDGTIAAHAWTFGDGGTSTATSPSHAYAAAGTYSVTETVTDNGGATGSKTSSVAVSSGTQLLLNTGFESTASWTASTGVICATGCQGESANSGTGFAWLDGMGTTHTDNLSQTVAIPAGKTSASLSYYLHIDTAETATTANDKLFVRLYSGSTLLKTLATYSNLNKNSGYTVHSNDVSAYIGQTVTVKFTGTENSALQTSFVLDDVTLNVN